MKDAAAQQGEASQQLEKAMEKLSAYGGLQPAIDKFTKLQKEQQQVAKEYKEAMKGALGKKPEDLTAGEKAKLKELSDKQDDLAKATQEALDKMGEKSEKMAKSDSVGAEAMKQAAQMGKTQGIPQKQSNAQAKSKDAPKGEPPPPNGASQDMQDNQQASAQQKHKEIDLGLEMILNKLRNAERRKLEQLREDLANAQKLVEELIVRQAGHNIDNLLLQDVKKVTDLSQKDRDELFAQAKREFAKLDEMKPELAVLTPSQEQTERNCRDYATKLQSLPDPAPSTKLTAARAKMEQAIFHLRKGQLADAYPDQAEALKALLAAKQAVDEAKKKADDEDQKNKEESIKQAYVKVLEQQKKLDEETKTIDTTPRNKDGELPVFLARRLEQLPDEQGKLSKDTQELDKKLEALGSIVYKWANKDIVSSMDEVKGELAKPETGKLTQAEQTRIEEQLQAMIDNLAKKPPERSKFDQADGGGGGSGGGKKPPKMPTDVELRLLKALQVSVNKNTEVADAEVKKNGGKKDAQKLLALGGRQGELRNVLDQLLQKATKGNVKLTDPKDNEQLPEEAGEAAIEGQELVNELLNDNGKAADTAEKTIKLVGDRMFRSRDRLAKGNDPGQTTQAIQKKIVSDLDGLIALAQKQQAASGKPKPGDPGDGDPQPGQPQGQPGGPQQAGSKSKDHAEGGESPAEQSTLSQGNDPQTDITKDLKEKASEWGSISPRLRDAVKEGQNEKLADQKYDQFVKDYYREVSKKVNGRQP